MTTAGEKLTLLAEIIRVSTKGATEAEISEELSLTSRQAGIYIQFLKSKRLLVLLDHRDYFPSDKGLVFLATYDEAADLVDIDGPEGFYSGSKSTDRHGSVYWNKTELAAKMREIIEK
jgi:hypothetical protein